MKLEKARKGKENEVRKKNKTTFVNPKPSVITTKVYGLNIRINRQRWSE